jgi:3-hydroxyacyl-CoA dehydrogenase
MGLGIAFVAARYAEASVQLYDSNQKALDKGLTFFGADRPACPSHRR